MGLRVAIIDANERIQSVDHYHELTSVVGQWLEYEMQQADYPLSHPAQADVILLVHSGELDYRQHCLRALNHYGIAPNPSQRKQSPYIITGGAVDAAPALALSIADALAVGEAYNLIRRMIGMLHDNCTIPDLHHWLSGYAHALTKAQFDAIPRDPARPYLFADTPPHLAQPDPYVDWAGTPGFTSDDGVTRIQAAKGCHLRCQFCATTYRQTYRTNDNTPALVQQMRDIKSDGGRVSLITNDAAALPFYDDIVAAGQLSFQSVTVKALRDPHILESVTNTRMKLVRFGVEGISERIRQAFGKRVSNNELLDMLAKMRAARQHVRVFFIAGAPYETAADWASFAYLMHQLHNQADWGTAWMKLTAFNPQPPTPLVYFVPGESYYQHWQKFHERISNRQALYHLKFIPPRHPRTRLKDLSDTFGVDGRKLLPAPGELVRDLAPDLQTAQRFTWEIIRWHLPVEKRWRLSRSYQKQMMNTP